MTPHSNTDIARLLLNKAKEDEQTIALIKSANGPWGVGCFHCQQAAEKRLKALLAMFADNFPKTHDISHLLSLAEAYCPALKELPDEVMLLGDYAVSVRYDDTVIANQSMFEDNMKWLQMVQQALQSVNMGL